MTIFIGILLILIILQQIEIVVLYKEIQKVQSFLGSVVFTIVSTGKKKEGSETE